MDPRLALDRNTFPRDSTEVPNDWRSSSSVHYAVGEPHFPVKTDFDPDLAISNSFINFPATGDHPNSNSARTRWTSSSTLEGSAGSSETGPLPGGSEKSYVEPDDPVEAPEVKYPESKSRPLRWQQHILSSDVRPHEKIKEVKSRSRSGRRKGQLNAESAKRAVEMRRIRSCLPCRISKTSVNSIPGSAWVEVTN